MNKFTQAEDNRRYEILGISPPATSWGGIVSFKNVSLDQLKDLADEGLIDLEDAQNSAPTVGEFMEFMANSNNDTLRAHGYLVVNERDDRRISIEGLSHESDESEDIKEFLRFNRRADECDDHFSWWD